MKKREFLKAFEELYDIDITDNQNILKGYYKYIYDEVLPLAFQYGQPLDEFWHGDLRLLEARQKAYIRDVCFRAWKQADYNRMAVEIGAKNAMATKQSNRIQSWIDFTDPIKKIIKENKKPQDYAVEQHNQNVWFYNIINK